MDDFRLSGRLVISGIDGLDAQVNILKNKLGNLSNIGNIGRGFKETSSGANKAAKDIQGLNREIRLTATGLQDFSDKSALALRRFSAFTIAASTIYGGARLVIGGLKEAAQFERQLIKVQQVANASTKSLNELRSEVARLGTELAAPAKDLVDVARTLSQAGLNINQVKLILEDLSRTRLAATFGTIQNTTEGVIALMGQFKIKASEVGDALALTNAVAAKYAVESEDLIGAVKRAGGAFAQSSSSIDDANKSLAKFYALVTSVRQTTRQSPETIATGLRTIFARIQRPSTINYLQDIGINLRDQQGNFIGAYAAIQKIGRALQNVNPRSELFTKVAEQVGGIRQYSIIIPLLREYQLQQDVLNKSLAEQQNYLKETELPLTTLVEKFNILANTWNTFARDVEQSPIFQFLAHQALDFATSLVKVFDKLSPIIPLLAVIGGAKLASTVYNEGILGVFGRRIFTGKSGIKRASGGYVPGFGRGDHVPLMAEPGEFVIRRDAATALGPRVLNSLNRYADGGLISGGTKSERLASGGPIIAWHGSPYDFDKFDINQIGKGQGAQTFGHGLYFAQNKAVALDYARELSKNNLSYLYKTAIHLNPENLLRLDNSFYQSSLQHQKSIFSLLKNRKLPHGVKYQGQNEIPYSQILAKTDVGISDLLRFLEYNYGDAVLNYRRSIGDPRRSSYRLNHIDAGKQNLYSDLEELGILGLVFYDQGSRFPIKYGKSKNIGDYVPNPNYHKTSNYVIFDDQHIDILSKYKREARAFDVKFTQMFPHFLQGGSPTRNNYLTNPLRVYYNNNAALNDALQSNSGLADLFKFNYETAGGRKFVMNASSLNDVTHISSIIGSLEGKGSLAEILPLIKKDLLGLGNSGLSFLTKGENKAQLRLFRSLFGKAGIKGHFATGGHIPGSGSGDKIPILAEPGEFIIRKAAAQKLGPSLLEKLNHADKFAEGGFVGNKEANETFKAFRNLSKSLGISNEEVLKVANEARTNATTLEELKKFLQGYIQALNSATKQHQLESEKVSLLVGLKQTEAKASKDAARAQLTQLKGGGTQSGSLNIPLSANLQEEQRQLRITEQRQQSIQAINNRRRQRQRHQLSTSYQFDQTLLEASAETVNPPYIAPLQESRARFPVPFSIRQQQALDKVRQARFLDTATKSKNIEQIADEALHTDIGPQRTLFNRGRITYNGPSSVDLYHPSETELGTGLYSTLSAQDIRNIGQSPNLRRRFNRLRSRLTRVQYGSGGFTDKLISGIGRPGALLAEGLGRADPIALGIAATAAEAFLPKSKYSSGISGALGGASTGAAIGNFFGPWGTGIGAAAGALYGGISGVLGYGKDEEEERVRKGLIQSTKDLDKAFRDLSVEGVRKTSNLLGERLNLINPSFQDPTSGSTWNNLFSFSSSRKLAELAPGRQVNAAQLDSAKNIAEQNSDVAQAAREQIKTLIKRGRYGDISKNLVLTSILDDPSLNLGNERGRLANFQTQILPELEKQVARETNVTNALQVIDTFSQRLSRSVSTIDAFNIHLDKTSNRTSEIFSAAQGNSSVGLNQNFVNPFVAIEGLNKKQIGNELSNLQGLLGTSFNKNIINTAQIIPDLTNFQDVLNNEIKKQNIAGGNLDEKQLAINLINSSTGTFKNLPKALKDQFTTIFENIDPAKFKEVLEGNNQTFNNAIDKIKEGTKRYLQAYEDAANKLLTQLETDAKSLDTLYVQRGTLAENYGNARTQGIELRNQIRGERPNAFLSIALQNQALGALTGGLTTPEEIYQDILKNQNNVNLITQKNINPFTGKEFTGSAKEQTVAQAKELAEFNANINKDTQALNELAASTRGLAAIQDELTDLEKRRSGAIDRTLEDVFGGNRRENFKADVAFKAFEQGDLATAIKFGGPQDIQRGYQRKLQELQFTESPKYIEEFQRRIGTQAAHLGVGIGAFSQQTANQRLNIINNPQIDKLKDAVDTAVKNQLDAITKQQQLLDQSIGLLDKTLTSKFINGIDNLAKTVKDFNIPDKIDMNVKIQDINVNVNGPNFAGLDKRMRQIAEEIINKAISQMTEGRISANQGLDMEAVVNSYGPNFGK